MTTLIYGVLSGTTAIASRVVTPDDKVRGARIFAQPLGQQHQRDRLLVRAGAVVGVFEILDAVNNNIVNGGFAWTHYWSGKHPAGLLFSAPTAGLGVGLDQVSVISWFYDGGGDELYQQFFTDILKN